MNRSGLSRLDLKRYHRSEILRMISRYGPMGRVDLASHLHLTRAAITQITNELISDGILYEKGEENLEGKKVSRGRKKILLDINENDCFSFGVVLDRKKVNIGLANLKGQTLDRKLVDLSTDCLSEIIRIVDGQIETILNENYLEKDVILGIGACVSDNAVPLFGKRKKSSCIQEFQRRLQQLVSFPVIAEGTTEGLAIAETVFCREIPERPNDMVMVRYGYDLDAAIMVQGEIYQGSRDAGGRLAHLVVDADGDLCSCGRRGCCMTRLSVSSIIRRMKQIYSSEKTPLLFEQTEGQIERVDFGIHCLKKLGSEPAYQEIFQDALRYLAAVLNNILVLLNPDQIILFGFMFEKVLDLSELIRIMKKENPELSDKAVVQSTITDANIHLAGNGLCVRKLFIEAGGYRL